MKQQITSLRTEARYSIALENGETLIRYAGMEARPYSRFNYASPDAEELRKMGDIAKKYYLDASLEELLGAFRDTENQIMPPNLVLNGFDTDGTLALGIFRKIAQKNPRFGERYQDGRLCKKRENGSGPEFDILDKSEGLVLHVYHSDSEGAWIRDVYELREDGTTKFHSYVHQAADAQYEADMDLAMAHGSMKTPKMADYSGSVPLTVHDPLSKMGTVRSAVGRILDSVRL